MSSKSTFLLIILILFFMVACTPKATSTPGVGQNQVAPIVAGTIQAVNTATQGAIVENTPTSTVTPSPLPTQPLPSPTAIPTITASPTPVNPALRIAYSKAGDIYLWTEGTGAVLLTNTHDASALHFSGDGMLIAFIRTDPNNPNSEELWAVSTSGGSNPYLLVSNSELLALMPPNQGSDFLRIGVNDFVWVPNTHQVAYSTITSGDMPGYSPHYDLHLVDAVTLVKSTLFDTGQGGIFYYSPDGSQIALSNPSSISLVNANGSHMRPDVLTFPPVMTYSEYAYTPHPIWAADSTSLRVTIPPEDPMLNPLPPTSLWSISVDGSPAELLGKIKAIPFYWPDSAFAPDLQHIAYVMPVGPLNSNRRELHLADPDGTNDTVYTNGDSLDFRSWAPDSQHFTYEIMSGINKGFYLGGFTAQPSLLTSDPRAMTIYWLDGDRFAYLLHANHQFELRISNLSGDDLGLIDTLPERFPGMDVFP
jgi:hypothetical protein